MHSFVECTTTGAERVNFAGLPHREYCGAVVSALVYFETTKHAKWHETWNCERKVCCLSLMLCLCECLECSARLKPLQRPRARRCGRAWKVPTDDHTLRGNLSSPANEVLSLPRDRSICYLGPSWGCNADLQKTYFIIFPSRINALLYSARSVSRGWTISLGMTEVSASVFVWVWFS